mgnify:CR=1 FL=1
MTLLMMVLSTIGQPVDEFSAGAAPSHPIVEWISEAGWIGVVQIFVMAAVIAPIVEEIMFRGVLYRHLRDATGRRRLVISVLFSGGISSFVFAAIHPQGIFGIPVLMSLAIGFCLAREWRGSLIAPMTMHAINNGLVTSMLVFTM